MPVGLKHSHLCESKESRDDVGKEVRRASKKKLALFWLVRNHQKSSPTNNFIRSNTSSFDPDDVYNHTDALCIYYTYYQLSSRLIES
jgi:hypothetical protein